MTVKDRLPMIAYFLDISDAGEYGAAICPHCGAKGRYTYNFVTTDGQELGAMSGCVKLYPIHRFALEHKRIMEKEKDGKKLNSWDIAIEDAIRDFVKGIISENRADTIIKTEKRKRTNWLKKRYH